MSAKPLRNGIVKGTIQKNIWVALTSRWSAVPGVIPEKVVAKRRAKNKAARKSRQKNRH